MKAIMVLLVAVVPCLGQQQSPIQDLNLLVGKKVIAQRVPLCQPGRIPSSSPMPVNRRR